MALERSPRKNLNVLIAEDNSRDAALMVATLNENGYSVTYDVVDREDRFRELLLSQNYDLVLADHNLPGWSGTDALELHRALGVDIPFIVVTATLGDEAAVEYIKQGASDYVLKFRLDRLPLVVDRALREKAYKDALRETHELLSAVIHAAPVAVIALDAQRRVRFWNLSAQRLFGWGEIEVVGETNPIGSPDSAQWQMLLERLDDGESLANVEIELATRHGQRVDAQLSAAPVRNANREIAGVVVVIADVTDRRVLEDQLRQSQKMEAVGRLAGGVVHDFNNLLTIMMGRCECLFECLPTSSAARRYADEIFSTGKQAASLTHQLLAFSRNQLLPRQSADLNAIVIDNKSMLQRLMGEDVELATDLDPDLAPVKVNVSQIEQMLLNLAANARDAMPHGGRFTIQTENIALPYPGTLHPMDLAAGGYVLLTVSDTGTGMTQETLKHLFEPFYTTKARGKGTGIGLSTVYGVVKQNEGSIHVNSKLNSGTIFHVYLPPTTELPQGKVSEGIASADGNETILLLEDASGVRQFTLDILERHGYHVLPAADAAAALRISGNHKGHIHLLLADIVLPSQSGPEVAALIAKQRPEMKILYMSGYTESMIHHHGILDLSSLISKPFTIKELTLKIREVIAQNPNKRAREA